MSESIWLVDDDLNHLSDSGGPPEIEEDREDGKTSKSASTTLVELALSRYRLGLSDDDDVFAVPEVGCQVVRSLRGSKGSMRAELASEYFRAKGKAAPQQALADAVLVLDGRARELDPERLWLRVAENSGDLYVDLGDSTGRAARISPSGWSLTDRPPVLFRRTALTGALPIPVSGGDLDELWHLLNVAEPDRPLVLAWLIAALDPSIPHPIAALTGEQGVGKTTAARILAGILDPSPAQVRSVPRDFDGWVFGATGSWVVTIDNVSQIAAWWSDALCRAVTGDGDVRRRLYSDADLAVYSFRRAIILTGIDLGALRGDLAERLVRIELNVIDSSTRRTDRALANAWDDAHPRILGAILDLAAQVLQAAKTLDLDHLPRMADFARVVAGVDQVLGTKGFDRYMGLADSLAGDVVASEPVIAAIVEQITVAFAGTAAELLSLITPPDGRLSRQWPSAPRALTAALRRNSPALRRLGWHVDFVNDPHTKVGVWHLAPSSASAGASHSPETGGSPAGSGAGSTPSAVPVPSFDPRRLGDPMPATPATPARGGHFRSPAGVAGVDTPTSPHECPHGVPSGDEPDEFVFGQLRCPECRKDHLDSNPQRSSTLDN